MNQKLQEVLQWFGIKVLIPCFGLLIIGMGATFGQSLNKAKKYQKNGEFFLAIKEYESYLDDESSDNTEKGEIYYYLGTSYLAINSYEKALQWYSKAMDSGYEEANPITFAQILVLNGKYSEANTLVKDIKTQFAPEVSVLKSSINLALSSTRYDTLYNVYNLTNLNSRYSDYAPALFEDKIVFTSSRPSNSTQIFEFNGQPYSNLYLAIPGEGIPVKIPGDLNSDYNDGNFSYSDQLKAAFYTQCNGYDGNDKHCNIYFSLFNQRSQTWSDGKKFNVMNGNYNSGHPAISSDGKILIFASNMPGGYGGSDLWMTINLNGTWQKPENLGDQVNTSGDELFPSLFADTTLYFASNGRQGYGGLDIYESTLKSGKFSSPNHLMLPVNSPADDFGLVKINSDSGYFSSNRTGGLGDDDIYAFSKIKYTSSKKGVVIEGVVSDKNNGEILAGAIAILETNGKSDTVITDLNGRYKFENININPEEEGTYNIRILNNDYLFDNQEITTADIKKFSSESDTNHVAVDFTLHQLSEDEITIRNIYYDFNKWNLRKESMGSLNRLVQLLKANPELAVQINSHTDTRGGENYNLKLSRNRAQSVVNYLVQNGIDESRLIAKGWGKSMPLIAGAIYEEEHEINRRTTFKVINYDEIKEKYQKKLKDLKDNLNKKNSSDGKYSSNQLPGSIYYQVEIKSSRQIIRPPSFVQLKNKVEGLAILSSEGEDGLFRYDFGNFTDIKEAENLLEQLKNSGYDGKIIARFNGKQIALK